MAQIYSENPRKIIQNKKILEKELKIKIERKGNLIDFESDAEQEYLALQVFDAISLGFSVPDALSIKEENTEFQKINIKEETPKKDLYRIRARIIGMQGSSLNVIESLTDCLIKIHNNEIGIIGKIMDIKKAEFALKKLIRGSKHANVYAYLERQKAEERQNF